MAFLLPRILITPFGGLIADRTNRKYLLIGALLLMNLSSFVTGFANSFGLVLAMRISLGVGEGLFIPAALSLIVDSFPPQRQTLALAVIGVGGAFGVALVF